MNIGAVIGEMSRDMEDMKQSLVPAGGIPGLLVFSSEKINITQVDLIIKKRFFSDSNAFLVGHPINGFIGAANGLGGGQIVLGSGGSTEAVEVYAQRRFTWRTSQELELGTKSSNMSIVNNQLKII